MMVVPDGVLTGFVPSPAHLEPLAEKHVASLSACSVNRKLDANLGFVDNSRAL